MNIPSITPTNPERRNSYVGRRKEEIGLEKAENLSSSELLSLFKSNVKAALSKKNIYSLSSVGGIYTLGKLKYSGYVGFYINLLTEDEQAKETAKIGIVLNQSQQSRVSHYIESPQDSYWLRDFSITVAGSGTENYIYLNVPSTLEASGITKIGINFYIFDADNFSGETLGFTPIFKIPSNYNQYSTFKIIPSPEGLPVYESPTSEDPIAKYNSSNTEYDYPTINGVPFTGLRTDEEKDVDPFRHITVTAKHSGPSRLSAGSHSWDVLGSYRRAGCTENTSAAVMGIENVGLARVRPESEKEYDYEGYQKLYGSTSSEKLFTYLNHLSCDELITGAQIKSLMYPLLSILQKKEYSVLSLDYKDSSLDDRLITFSQDGGKELRYFDTHYYNATIGGDISSSIGSPEGFTYSVSPNISGIKVKLEKADSETVPHLEVTADQYLLGLAPRVSTIMVYIKNNESKASPLYYYVYQEAPKIQDLYLLVSYDNGNNWTSAGDSIKLSMDENNASCQLKLIKDGEVLKTISKTVTSQSTDFSATINDLSNGIYYLDIKRSDTANLMSTVIDLEFSDSLSTSVLARTSVTVEVLDKTLSLIPLNDDSRQYILVDKDQSVPKIQGSGTLKFKVSCGVDWAINATGDFTDYSITTTSSSTSMDSTYFLKYFSRGTSNLTIEYPENYGEKSRELSLCIYMLPDQVEKKQAKYIKFIQEPSVQQSLKFIYPISRGIAPLPNLETLGFYGGDKKKCDLVVSTLPSSVYMKQHIRNGYGWRLQGIGVQSTQVSWKIIIDDEPAKSKLKFYKGNSTMVSGVYSDQNDKLLATLLTPDSLLGSSSNETRVSDIIFYQNNVDSDDNTNSETLKIQFQPTTTSEDVNSLSIWVHPTSSLPPKSGTDIYNYTFATFIDGYDDGAEQETMLFNIYENALYYETIPVSGGDYLPSLIYRGSIRISLDYSNLSSDEKNSAAKLYDTSSRNELSVYRKTSTSNEFSCIDGQIKLEFSKNSSGKERLVTLNVYADTSGTHKNPIARLHLLQKAN